MRPFGRRRPPHQKQPTDPRSGAFLRSSRSRRRSRAPSSSRSSAPAACALSTGTPSGQFSFATALVTAASWGARSSLDAAMVSSLERLDVRCRRRSCCRPGVRAGGRSRRVARPGCERHPVVQSPSRVAGGAGRGRARGWRRGQLRPVGGSWVGIVMVDAPDAAQCLDRRRPWRSGGRPMPGAPSAGDIAEPRIAPSRGRDLGAPQHRATTHRQRFAPCAVNAMSISVSLRSQRRMQG